MKRLLLILSILSSSIVAMGQTLTLREPVICNLEEIAGTDGLVLGSPVYFGDITAQMRIGRHQSRRNRTPRGAYILLIIIIFFSYFAIYMHR